MGRSIHAALKTKVEAPVLFGGNHGDATWRISEHRGGVPHATTSDGPGERDRSSFSSWSRLLSGYFLGSVSFGTREEMTLSADNLKLYGGGRLGMGLRFSFSLP